MSENIKSEFNNLDNKRQNVLERGRENSLNTIPSVLPDKGFDESSNLKNNYHSIGSLGVSGLANKLLLALFPANNAFFRLSIDDEILDNENEDIIEEFKNGIAKIEKEIMNEVETKAYRVPILQALISLIVTGNSLIYMPEQKNTGIRVFRLDSYVIDRDNFGNVLKIVTKEMISPLGLPDSIKQNVIEKLNIEDKDLSEDIELYTIIKLTDNNKWKISQEVEDVLIPESEGEFDYDNSPFIPLRWTAISGENYGRGHVENIIEDLNALNILNKSSLQIAGISSKTVFTVRKNGNTRIEDVARARNGDIISGDANDVSTIQSQKGVDLNIVINSVDKIERRLSQVFMSNTSIQRDAERVTAEEIRYMAEELETNLGGVYSLLSQELQLPLVKRLIKVMTKQNKIPKLPNSIKPKITTGIEALGRGQDVNKMREFIQTLSLLVGPEQTIQRLNVDSIAAELGLGLGIDTKTLIKTKEQMQQQQIEDMGNKVAEQVLPNQIQTQLQGE